MVTNQENLPDHKKIPLLLHHLGTEEQRIYNTFSDNHTIYEDAIFALASYFTPKSTLIYRIFLFRRRRQASDESIQSYMADLRSLVALCEYKNLEE